MIEDVFFRRYGEEDCFRDLAMQLKLERVILQGGIIYAEEVDERLGDNSSVHSRAQKQLMRELGHPIFPYDVGLTPPHVSYKFLFEGNDKVSFEWLLKLKLSLLELLFRYVGRQTLSVQVGRSLPQGIRSVIDPAIDEMNGRFAIAGVPFHYHNGFFQLSADQLSEERVREPFWSLTSDPKWVNVDMDMKEAVDHADKNERDAALYATKALESTIKIISNEQGWTTGRERGAVNYIDNLVSQKNGRFIEVWEAEALKAIFSNLRNPHGHGPGNDAQPKLSAAQTEWAIETCMSWIKSLIRRG